MHPPKQHHLEVVARLRGIPDVQFGLREQIERAHEIFAREARRQRHELLTLVGGEITITRAAVNTLRLASNPIRSALISA